MDCSIEYDLPNVPKISAGKDGKVEPILMIHPAYLKQQKAQQIPENRVNSGIAYPQPVVCNVRDCQCQMVMARQRQMLLQQQQQQQFIRRQQQQQQQQVEASRKAVKRSSYEANFQQQTTNMNAAGKARAA